MARARRLASFVALVAVGAGAGQLWATPQRGKGRTGRFRAAYEAPKDPRHQELHDRLKKVQALEKFSVALSALRLPRPLLIKFAGCDGTANAWYSTAEGTVTFCYEYAAEILQDAAGAAEHGIPEQEAFEGGIAFVLLHETAHALFDLLEVPVLGREEDAADNVAACLLLRAGEGIARRVLRGAAWMYAHGARAHEPEESDFADVHGLDAQRFYNVMCIAHGSNPEAFNAVVEKGYLPKERAEGCAEEFHQVSYAVSKLIDPSLDAQAWARTKAAHKARWEAPAKPAHPADAQR